MKGVCLGLSEVFIVECIVLVVLLIGSIKLVESLCRFSLLGRQVGRKTYNKKYLKVKENIWKSFRERKKQLKKLVKNIIVISLKISLPSCGNDEKEKYVEQIRKIFRDIIGTEVEANANNEKEDWEMMEKAFRFILKKNFLLHPLDIQGSRRCHILESIFTDVWGKFPKLAGIENGDNKISVIQVEGCLQNNNETEVKVKMEVPIWMYYVKPLMITAILTVGLWALDCLYTDPAMIYLFVSMASEIKYFNRTAPNLNNEDTSVKLTHLSDVIWTLVPILILSYVGPLLFALYTNPVKKMIRSFQAMVAMSLPANEEMGIAVDPTVCVTRHHLSIDEAGFESVSQLTYQWGIYFSFTNAVHELGGEAWVPDNIRSYFAFSSQVLPWLSAAASILSLTLHQFKSNATQHEFSMNGVQKLFLFFASVFNTLSYTCIFISFSTGIFDLVFYSHPGLVGQIFIILASFFLMASLMQAVRYSQKLFIIPGLGSEDRMPVPLAGHNSRAWYITFYKLIFNCNVAALMELPVTRHKIYYPQQNPLSTTSYITFNSIRSSNVYLGFVRQSVSYIITISLICLLFCINVYVFGLDVTAVPTRLNFHIVSMVFIPGGHLISYLFLWIFLKLDKGTLTVTDLRWMNGQHEEEAEEELGTVEEEEETYPEDHQICSYYICCVTCQVQQDMSCRNEWVHKPLMLQGVWEDLNYIENVPN